MSSGPLGISDTLVGSGGGVSATTSMVAERLGPNDQDRFDRDNPASTLPIIRPEDPGRFNSRLRSPDDVVGRSAADSLADLELGNQRLDWSTRDPALMRRKGSLSPAGATATVCFCDRGFGELFVMSLILRVISRSSSLSKDGTSKEESEVGFCPLNCHEDKAINSGVEFDLVIPEVCSMAGAMTIVAPLIAWQSQKETNPSGEVAVQTASNPREHPKKV